MNVAEIKTWLVDTGGCGGIARRDHVEWLIHEAERLETELCRYYHADGTFSHYATPELALEARQQAAKDMKRMKLALEKISEDAWMDMDARDVARGALAETV